MPERLSAQQRGALMARVKGKDTKPELIVRSLLHRMGYRFRLHRKDLPGRPDIVLPRHKKVVLVHGCFWHQHPGCSRSKRPETKSDFWNAKLDRNVERDKETLDALGRLGWAALVIWECETKSPKELTVKLREFMAKK